MNLAVVMQGDANPPTPASVKQLTKHNKQNCPILFCKMLDRFVLQNDQRILPRVLLGLDPFTNLSTGDAAACRLGFFPYTRARKTNAEL